MLFGIYLKICFYCCFGNFYWDLEFIGGEGAGKGEEKEKEKVEDIKTYKSDSPYLAAGEL